VRAGDVDEAVVVAKCGMLPAHTTVAVESPTSPLPLAVVDNVDKDCNQLESHGSGLSPASSRLLQVVALWECTEHARVVVVRTWIGRDQRIMDCWELHAPRNATVRRFRGAAAAT